MAESEVIHFLCRAQRAASTRCFRLQSRFEPVISFLSICPVIAKARAPVADPLTSHRQDEWKSPMKLDLFRQFVELNQSVRSVCSWA